MPNMEEFWRDSRVRSDRVVAAWNRLKAGDGWLYVLAFDATAEIKIGYSFDPMRRAKELKGRLLGTIKGNIMHEKAVHKLLRSIDPRRRIPTNSGVKYWGETYGRVELVQFLNAWKTREPA